jgi:hypothetical protein
MPKSRPKRIQRRPDPRQRPARSGMSWRAGYRPPWHRILGWVLIAIGALIVVVNDAAYVDINLMPGGHNEAYFVLGLLVAGFGSWWTGLFDRP